ncbi:N-carbamoyl-D-amino acid hydrolase [Botrimarina hoheduenensis]|uniref:N-carbamoyl-D-amino acid hydrolase n=2 Tax=Botrimarina hoheduenensis TaxID=2528000 RepID=A0A5C5WBJ6_9BACT|nr:N-carbamoyl-D-amino acid hydrolase [Botrimarina hoheduenensis]
MPCQPEVVANRDRAEQLVRDAAKRGAQVICLQELFDARYCGQTVDVKGYELAEPLPSPTTERFGRLAGELGVVLIVPIYEEARPGVYFNSVVVYDADGSLVGKYRKTHIPDGPQYLEKYYFTPGDLGYKVFPTRFGVLGVAICWDEWYPEVARIMALMGAEILFYPSAIGSEPDEPELSTQEAWKTVIRAHGVANNVFVAAVNRVGVEDQMTFYGGSFLSGPLGEVLCEGRDREEVLIASADLAQIRKARNLLHFLRDRRIDTYGPLLQRLVEPNDN